MCSIYDTFKDLQVYFVSLVKIKLILGKPYTIRANNGLEVNSGFSGMQKL
jgi:hypothetical protein